MRDHATLLGHGKRVAATGSRQDAPKHRGPAVFLDRDGTLNPDFRYLKDALRLELFRGVTLGIRLLNEHGFRVLCVTNQSGIARGFYTADDVELIHRRINARLSAGGARVDAFYFCPHLPNSGCSCRKPGTGLFQQAAQEWNIELSASAVIGDRLYDIQAGDQLGLLTALVLRAGRLDEFVGRSNRYGLKPDIRSNHFLGAVRAVLERG
ncbi:MAG: HAD family hydrolase [Thermoplasmata archaeon]